jgi:uncharacterized protein YhaN
VRILEIAVDGFGLLHGTRIRPDPGLTVVRGQNEAGKTTLLAFVRAMFFGFETNRYRALAGGRRGGWLDVEMVDARRFRIERYGETGGGGRLRVLDTAGVDLGPGVLPILLQGVEQRVFRNIFAFGLDELAQFERLTDNEVAARIYGAGLGLGAVSALEVELALRKAKEDLFKPGGHNPSLNVTLRRIEEVDGRLRALDLPREYGEGQAHLKELDERLEEVAAELLGMGAEQRTFERLVDGWPIWIDLEDARRERAELGEARTYPTGTLERHGSLETARLTATDAAARATDRRVRREEELAALAIDETILARRAEVEAILEQALLDRTRRDELERVARERDLARSQLEESLRRLGEGWTPERVAGFDDSIAVQTEISGRFRTRLDRAAEALAAVRRDVATTETGLADARAELVGLETALAEVTESIAGRVNPEAREQQLRAIDDLRTRLEIARSAERVGGAPAGAGAGAGVGGNLIGRRSAVVVTVGGLLGALVGALALLAGAPVWVAPILVLGLALAVGAAAAYLIGRPRPGGVGAPTGVGADLTSRLAAACLAAGLAPAPSDADLIAARAVLAADRELEARRIGLAEQRDTVGRRLALLELRQGEQAEALVLAERDADAARVEWSAWLAGHGLDPALDRETAARVLDTVTAAKRPLQSLRVSEARLAQLQDEHAAFAAVLGALAELLPGGRLDAARLPESIAELDRRWKVATDQERTRRAIGQELDGLRRDEEEARRNEERARAQYEAFLLELGVPDADTLRADTERGARAGSLEDRIARATSALTALSGPGQALAGFQEALATIVDIELTRGRIAELGEAITDLEATRSRLHEEAGALRDRLAEMERDVAATADRQERSNVQARLEAEAEDWAVLALATAILARARGAYETAHRPAVVESAERYFREWTDGRYVRILAPLGHQVEAVEHRDGTYVPLAGLSRGTAEQLYLALRFGLVEHFAAGAEALPIVMDDILVNFDEERAARAARSIEELAGRNQVMYFTCHPETPLEADADIDLPRLVGAAEARALTAE